MYRLTPKAPMVHGIPANVTQWHSTGYDEDGNPVLT